MAFTFAAASSQYMEGLYAAFTGSVFTMATWFYADDVTNSYALMSVCNNAANNRQVLFAAGASGDVITLNSVGASSVAANSSTTYTAGTWNHAAGGQIAANSRWAMCNGAGYATETTSVTPTGLNRTLLASRYDGAGARGAFLNGRLHWPAIWNVSLPQPAVVALSQGLHPFKLEAYRKNLIWFPPLALSEAIPNDWISRRPFTIGGSPVRSNIAQVRQIVNSAGGELIRRYPLLKRPRWSWMESPSSSGQFIPIIGRGPGLALAAGRGLAG